MLSALYAQQADFSNQDYITKQGRIIDSLKKIILENESNKQQLKSQKGSVNKQKLEIDSLNKITNTNAESIKNYKTDSTNRKNEFEKFKKEQKDLKDYEAGMKTHKGLLQSKTDSISDQKKLISTKDSLLVVKNKECEQKAIKEKESGKNEILSIITNTYKNKTFDSLINSSSRLSAQNDLRMLGNSSDIKPILDDLENYFSAKAAFEKKYNPAVINEALQKLKSIAQKSDSRVSNLIEKVENYQTVHEGLIEMLDKIKKLDGKEDVAGMGEVNFQKKHYKILSEITKYIFDYDFNFSDYPYLSDIVLEVIKRKQPNPDADISDLLKKL